MDSIRAVNIVRANKETLGRIIKIEIMHSACKAAVMKRTYFVTDDEYQRGLI